MDRQLLLLMVGSYILLQIFWFVMDPRPFKERLIFHFLLRQNLFSRMVVLGILILILGIHFYHSLFSSLKINAGSLNELLTILGLVLYVSGFIVCIWARLTMKRVWNPAGEKHNIKRQNRLITNGPFKYSRNPIYMGLLLIYAGFFIALRSYLIILIVPVFIGFYKVILNEEKILEKYFGNQYLSYRKRVGRFI